MATRGLSAPVIGRVHTTRFRTVRDRSRMVRGLLPVSTREKPPLDQEWAGANRSRSVASGRLCTFFDLINRRRITVTILPCNIRPNHQWKVVLFCTISLRYRCLRLASPWATSMALQFMQIRPSVFYSTCMHLTEIEKAQTRQQVISQFTEVAYTDYLCLSLRC